VLDSSGPSENDIRSSLVQAGSRIAHCAFAYTPEAQHTELNCDSHWLAAASENEVPGVIRALAERPGVIRIAWAPQAK
jgi:hypothetical protein